ncbi:MAG: T9SS type A sorting domain-containing protein [Aureispira sp.]
MNTTTIQEQLKKHYQKLQARLQKAQSKGRSQSFQELLMSRIQRCAIQLRQLGAGVAVVTALGWAAPALGQNTIPLDYEEKVGVDNPLDSMGNADNLYFSDLDGDGDKDLIRQELMSSPSRFEFSYYQNVGSPTTPSFQQVSSSVPDSLSEYATRLTFVDIDGDNDFDLFTADYAYYSGSTTTKVNYYKNEGSPSSPDFTLMDTANNPLQKAADYYNALNLPAPPKLYTHFMDVDGDGDQDCFVGAGSSYPAFPTTNSGDRVLYYKNEGNVNSPDFQLQSAVDNPLDIVNTTLPAGYIFEQPLFLFDADSIRDGNVDALLRARDAPGNFFMYHFKNTGTVGNPAFVLSATTPLDNVPPVHLVNTTSIKAAEDLTNNGRTEIMMSIGFGASTQWKYFVDTVSVLNQFILQGAKPLEAYPNPSAGIIQLEQSYTGLLEVFTTTGQLVYKRELEEVEQLNLELLDTGIYVVSLQTPKERLVQQVTIIK